MRRYESLDSIRGIAALAVVFSHMFIVFPAFYSALSLQQNNQLIVDLLAFTPLHLLWSGHEAVVLFFILSGFVLSLPYLNNRKLIYTNYIVQRVFRIYIPYIVIILFSIILQSFLYTPGGIAGLSKWFNWMWMLPLSPGLFSHFLFMSGELTHNYNTASWSLVHEMRISLIFPFIVLLIRRKNLLFDLGLLALVFAGRYALPTDLPYKINDTFYYALFFVIGAVLAKHREALGILFLKTGTYFKISLFAIALLLYNWHWNFGMVLPADSPLHQLFADRIIGDIAIGIGACIFFLFAIHSAWTEKILTHRIPMFLGKVSYSLYLVHPVVILALFYSLHAWVHPLLIFAMVPFASLAVATVYHYSVEVTAMKTGKLLTSKKAPKISKGFEAQKY